MTVNKYDWPPARLAEGPRSDVSLRAYGDTWELVEDYWRVMDYAARHPNLGLQALASRLDLPRSRIRPWVRDPDGDRKPARPDVVRGIQTAEGHGWIPARYDAEAFPALNRAVAWVLSGGSIDEERYVPLFTVGGEVTLNDLETLLDRLGGGCTTSRETEVESESGRAAEYRPATDASVLGRVLSLLGVPVGSKNADTSIELPAYLDNAPDPIRRGFVEVYLRNRGVWQAQSRILKFREERSPSYLRALARLIEDVSSAPVSVSEYNIILSVDATHAVGVDRGIGE